MMEEFDMVMTFDMPAMDYPMEEIAIEMPIEVDTIGVMMEEYIEGTISYEEVIVEVQEMVQEIQDIGMGVSRKRFLQEWMDIKNTVFSPENLNKMLSFQYLPSLPRSNPVQQQG